jgi:hypothetical protein
MARINIEDSIYQDYRFIDLREKVGDHYKALGILISAWALAQKHYLTTVNDRSIPFNEWDRSPFGVILEVGLATKGNMGVKLCGSDKQFSWLLQRSNAGKTTKTTKKDKRPKTDVKRPLTVEQPLTLTPTLTPTPTPTLAPAPTGFPSTKIWESYRDAYLLRYGVEPVRNAKINSQIFQVGKRLGSDAIEVCKFFLTHNNSWYLQTSHSVDALLKNAESLHSEWQRGIQITQTKIRSFEKANQTQELIEKIKREGV